MNEPEYIKNLVSIVMPAYNHADLVIPMLQSIIDNTYREWELIIVDDGSEEEEYQKMDEFTSRDFRITHLRRTIQPKGAQTCRNIGFERAKGEYICFFDSDDYITPVCLATRVESMKANPDIDFSIFPTGVYCDGEFIKHGRPQIFGYPTFNDDIANFASRTLPFIVCSNIYRTASLRQHGIRWDENLLSLQDSDFNMQSLVAGLKYKYALKEPDYFYCIEANPNSVSKKIVSEKHFESHLYLIRKNYASLINRYGNKYNAAVYKGVLYLFNAVFSNEVNRVRAKQMHKTIAEYDSYRGIMFKLRLRMLFFLEHFLSPRAARRVVMIDYLLWLSRHSKKKQQTIASWQAKLGIK